jgi:hypothetical protein
VTVVLHESEVLEAGFNQPQSLASGARTELEGGEVLSVLLSVVT